MARDPSPGSSALVVDVHVLGVDHLVGGGAGLPRAATGGPTRRTRRTSAARPGSPALGTALAVHHLSQLVRGLGQPLESLLHGLGVVRLQGLAGLAERLFELT